MFFSKFSGYKDTSGMSKFTSGELEFDSLIRMAEGSLQKAGPILDLLSVRSSDPVELLLMVSKGIF